MSSQDQAVVTINLAPHGFKHVASGKVREIFEVDEHTFLFVATDRISAYDVILENVSDALLGLFASLVRRGVTSMSKHTSRHKEQYFPPCSCVYRHIFHLQQDI